MSKDVGKHIYKIVKAKKLRRMDVAALASMTPGNLSKIYKRDELYPSQMVMFSKILKSDLFALYREELEGIEGSVIQELSDENAGLREELAAMKVECERVQREADKNEKLYVLMEEKNEKLEAEVKPYRMLQAGSDQQDEEPIAQPEPKLYKAPPRKKTP